MSLRAAAMPVLGVLLSGLLLPAPARATDLLDYFAMSIPDAWMAVDPSDRGSFEKITEDRGCVGRTIYHHVKGAGIPWASESFYLQGAWVLATSEVSYHGPGIREFRTFREATEVRIGIPWLPSSLASGGEERWQTPPYVEEYWCGDDGKPSCDSARHEDRTGSLRQMVATLEVLPGWVRDVRSTSADPEARHDVETVRVERDWAKSQEIYWYGRWRDPQTGALEGLGLVRWELWNVDGEKRLTERRHFRYLVEHAAGALPRCRPCPI